MEKDALTAFRLHAAATDDEGERYLTRDTFVDAVAPSECENFEKIGRNSYAVLFDVADRRRRGRVYLQDFLEFDKLLDRPDAEFVVAFNLFDRESRGFVDFREFVSTYNKNRSPNSIPFDWSGPWAQLYLGMERHRHRMSYHQFCQMLSGLAGERVRQYFQQLDGQGRGFITPDQFEELVYRTARYRLSDKLLKSLHTVTNRNSAHCGMVSYATVRAFYNLINRVEVVEQIARSAADQNGLFTRDRFSDRAARMLSWGFFTPLEIDLLFFFAHSSGHNADVASLEAFEMMFDPTWRTKESRYFASWLRKVHAAQNFRTDPSQFISEVFESVYNFGLGSVAGALGATVVYPIDLVKTRMQNQRGASRSSPNVKAKVPPRLYKNSIDCFRHVIKNEGIRGLYSGLGPQLLGVAPEKAIKLAVNDLVRGNCARGDGTVPFAAEVAAGGSAGACQVLFTNPLEIVKIRLQVQGETGMKQSALDVLRGVGVTGLYRGVTACLLRDVPFSAIYFPAYAHLKHDLFGEGPAKRLRLWELLCCGAIAGVPAAYLTTPMDVVKTRLQVKPRAGEVAYKGLRDAFVRISREEGFRAFFKGGPARVLRSSPQFGCTLAAYEALKRLAPFHHEDTTEAGHSVPTAKRQQDMNVLDLKYLRSRNSLKLLLSIDENFGAMKLSDSEK